MAVDYNKQNQNNLQVIFLIKAYTEIFKSCYVPVQNFIYFVSQSMLEINLYLSIYYFKNLNSKQRLCLLQSKIKLSYYIEPYNIVLYFYSQFSQFIKEINTQYVCEQYTLKERKYVTVILCFYSDAVVFGLCKLLKWLSWFQNTTLFSIN